MPDRSYGRDALLLCAGAAGGAALWALGRRKVKQMVAEMKSSNFYSTMSIGQEDTHAYRIAAFDPTKTKNNMMSLWHDVPLCVLDRLGNATTTFNFICEIPKWTNKKYEIATKEAGNPIKQDEKKGQLRTFKKGDIYFNYGCFPRTWEDPNYVHPDTGVGGDNDPLDVCEIGLKQIAVGAHRPVKVLGILCMIDDGETDWKVIAIDVEDRWAAELNDVDDVERLLPGTIHTIREWFRTYKVPDGKPENKFGLGEKCMPRAYALKIVEETHNAWKELLTQGAEEEEAPPEDGPPSPKPSMGEKKLSFPKLADLCDDSLKNDSMGVKKLSNENLRILG